MIIFVNQLANSLSLPEECILYLTMPLSLTVFALQNHPIVVDVELPAMFWLLYAEPVLDSTICGLEDVTICLVGFDCMLKG